MKIRLAIAQINCTVGDLGGNAGKISDYIRRATGAGADMVIFPELAVTGYPPEDLLLKPKFIADNLEAVARIARATDAIIAVIGFVCLGEAGIFNSAAVICKGEVKGIYNKAHLPNYGVFDEKRYFLAGKDDPVFRIGDLTFGVTVCEDIWNRGGPASRQAANGAELIVNINSSPYHLGKTEEREAVISNEARANRAFIAYANMVGGQDELVFDGQSMVVGPDGSIVARAKAFEEDLLVADIELPGKAGHSAKAVTIAGTLEAKARPAIRERTIARLERPADAYRALMLGLTDYVRKNGFSRVVIGLSGGIDSSLVAALAADALGKDNVTGVFMPTRYSSTASEDDARALASNLGIAFTVIPIDGIYALYLESLERPFAGTPRGTAEENLQARIRGNILMALSNKSGWLVLTTGNKSEMSTGYATLYGDMAGGLAVIKDVPKTLVYELAKYRNSLGAVIPGPVLTKEPTAELRENQKDSDSLPPYDLLDPIIKAYVEEDRSPAEIAAMGFDKGTVAKVVSLIDKSEYKRRQSPPGIKITPKAFGRDRRMPITNRYT